MQRLRSFGAAQPLRFGAQGSVVSEVFGRTGKLYMRAESNYCSIFTENPPTAFLKRTLFNSGVGANPKAILTSTRKETVVVTAVN